MSMRVSKYKVANCGSRLVSAVIDADERGIERELFDVVESSLGYLFDNRKGTDDVRELSEFAEELSELVERYI